MLHGYKKSRYNIYDNLEFLGLNSYELKHFCFGEGESGDDAGADYDSSIGEAVSQAVNAGSDFDAMAGGDQSDPSVGEVDPGATFGSFGDPGSLGFTGYNVSDVGPSSLEQQARNLETIYNLPYMSVTPPEAPDPFRDPETPEPPSTFGYPTFKSGLSAIGKGAMDLTDFLYEGFSNLSPLGFALSALGVTNTSSIGKSFGQYAGLRGDKEAIDLSFSRGLSSSVKDAIQDIGRGEKSADAITAYGDPLAALGISNKDQTFQEFQQEQEKSVDYFDTPAPDSISQEVATQQTEAPASTPSSLDTYDYGFPDSGGVPLAPPIPSVPTVAPQPAAEVVTPEPRVRTAAENTRRLLEGIYGEKITADLLKDRTDLSRIV
jgi:hypothetical protein